MPDPRIETAHDGHGADAEKNAGGDKTVREAAGRPGAAFRKSGLDGIAGRSDGIVVVLPVYAEGVPGICECPVSLPVLVHPDSILLEVVGDVFLNVLPRLFRQMALGDADDGFVPCNAPSVNVRPA